MRDWTPGDALDVATRGSQAEWMLVKGSRILSGEAARVGFVCPLLVPTQTVAEEIVGDLGTFELLLTLEGEVHTLRRRRIWSAFSKRAVKLWEPRLVERARRRCSEMPLGESVDFLEWYARHLAYESAADLVGLSNGSRERALRDARCLMTTGTSKRRRALSTLRLLRLLEEEMSANRNENLSGRTLVGGLCEHASTEDIVAVGMSVLTGGTELAARAIGACAAASWCRAGEITISEVDRLLSGSGIVPTVERVAMDDVVAESEHIKCGERVSLDLTAPIPPGTDRGPVFPAFGFGRHYCVGAAWIRQLCVVACNEWYRHFGVPPDIEMRSAPLDSVIRGPVALIIRVVE